MGTSRALENSQGKILVTSYIHCSPLSPEKEEKRAGSQTYLDLLAITSSKHFILFVSHSTHLKMEVATEPTKKNVRTTFQLAAVQNGLKGRNFGELGKESGVKSKPFGSRGGRPKSRKESAIALTESMTCTPHRDFVIFLRSSKLYPYFPPRITSREKRKAFKTKSKKFRLHPSKGFVQKGRSPNVKSCRFL